MWFRPDPASLPPFRVPSGPWSWGSRSKPEDDLLDKAHQTMREWALDGVAKANPKRGELMEWLKNEFDLGGPLLRATPKPSTIGGCNAAKAVRSNIRTYKQRLLGRA